MSFSLAPRRRYRDLIEHKILAVTGEHQTPPEWIKSSFDREHLIDGLDNFI